VWTVGVTPIVVDSNLLGSVDPNSIVFKNFVWRLLGVLRPGILNENFIGSSLKIFQDNVAKSYPIAEVLFPESWIGVQWVRTISSDKNLSHNFARFATVWVHTGVVSV